MTPGTRPHERAPIALMVTVGVIATAVGVVWGLAIDWFPEEGSSQAGPVDLLWDVLIVASVPVFVLVTTIVGFSMWKFRMRAGEEHLDGPPIHGNTRLEVIWTAIPAIVLVALCSYSYIVLVDIEESKAGEMPITVIGQQFTWTFEYPATAGQKPVRSNQLYVAKDKPVKFIVQSKDVIHDFWVPAFRMKIDAVPGIDTSYRITPTRLGTYPVVCAELCGLGHSFMRQSAHVVTPEAFAAWLAKQGAPAQASGGSTPDGKQLFTAGNGDATACGGCHKLADAGTSGGVGPDLDKALPGMSAADIRESIVKPDAKVEKGFPAAIMPPNYGDTLSPEELDALVEYLGKVAGKG